MCVCVCARVCVRRNNGRQTINQFSSPFDSFHFFARYLIFLSLTVCSSFFSSPLASLSFYFAHATVSHFSSALDGFAPAAASALFWKCQKTSVKQSKLICEHVYRWLSSSGCEFDSVTDIQTYISKVQHGRISHLSNSYSEQLGGQRVARVTANCF